MKVLSLLSLFLFSIQPLAGSQNVPPALVKVSEALDCIKTEGMRGWTRERVQPLTGSESVLVDVWSSGGRRVKVSILYYRSEGNAAESMRRLVSDGSVKKIPGLGDEAYSWGYSDNVALRKGNITAFVSAISDIDVLLPAVEDSEKSGLREAEQVALNKNFARIMAAVLADPSTACSYERF